MISVIVPAFNAAETFGIGPVSAAFLASDYANFEVIVVDDHSTDDTRAVARSLPCKLIERPVNEGAAGARNLGAAAASGSILFFVDADISIQPDSLRRIVTLLDEHPELAAVFGSYQAETPPADFFSHTRTCSITTLTKSHRRKPRPSRADSVRCAAKYLMLCGDSIPAGDFSKTLSSATECIWPAIA